MIDIRATSAMNTMMVMMTMKVMTMLDVMMLNLTKKTNNKLVLVCFFFFLLKTVRTNEFLTLLGLKYNFYNDNIQFEAMLKSFLFCKFSVKYLFRECAYSE